MSQPISRENIAIREILKEEDQDIPKKSAYEELLDSIETKKLKSVPKKHDNQGDDQGYSDEKFEDEKSPLTDSGEKAILPG